MKFYFNRNAFFVASIIAIVTRLSFADPEISVDSTDFDIGIIREGSIEAIEHTYKVKNSGDKPLKIDRVKPSCGCTAVGHDTIIAPGKVGTISAKIHIGKFTPGNLKKYITVFSNAKNKPELTLSLACTIRSDLNIEPRYVHMVADKNNMLQDTFTIITNKNDLEVQSVSFIENSSGTSNAAWQNNLPIGFSYQLAKTDKKHSDGFVEYKLPIHLIFEVPDNEIMYGKFIFKTNHPTKNNVELTGTIAPSVKK